MQLILDTEPTIDIKRNMSTLNEETLAEKLDDVIEDLKSGLCNGNKENIQCQENIITCIEEPNSDNDKIEEIIAAPSLIPEQSVDTILKSPDLDDSMETPVKSPNCNDITEMAAKSPKPETVTETAAKSPKPESVIETAAKPPKPESVTEIAATSPKPESVTKTATASPKPESVSETAAKSPKPEIDSEKAEKSPKPDENTVTESVLLDDKHSAGENVHEIENEKLDIDIPKKDAKGTTDSVNTEDSALRMEDDSPAFADDQTNNDEESDPIIITHGIMSCLKGQEEEINEKNEKVTEKTDIINVEVNENVEINKNVDVSNVVITNELDERVDENMVDVQVNEETAHILEEDTTSMNGIKEVRDRKEGNNGNIIEVEDEKTEEVVDGTCPHRNDSDDRTIVDVDNAKMKEQIVENGIQSLSPHKVDISNESNIEHTSNSFDAKRTNEDVTKKSSSEMNNIDESVDTSKEIETVNLDDEEKESDNGEKSLRVENLGESNVQTPLKNNSVSDDNENTVAEMETVDLIDEKDGSGLESMEVDFIGETGKPEEKPISLSSEKDDIFDCDDNLDVAVPMEETLTDKTANVESKNSVTPMDEDVQPVEDKNSQQSLDTKKEETINILDEEVKEQESKNDGPAKEITQTSSQPSKATDEAKTIPSVLKLSNTLNILSDDEDEITEPPKTATPLQDTVVEFPAENKCINIEDDDDIMLIDEEENNKESKSEPAKPEAPCSDSEPKVDVQESEKKVDIESSENSPENAEKTTESPGEKSPVDKEKPEDEKNEKISEPKTEPIKPLVPTNFLKTCKKNMAEMTRDDLEEFCILKIVESVVDRSSLSEIKSKLKGMAQSIEDYKKKAQMLQKQNRDLQVVLKTIQEEQKNSKTVTPLKITRSVGMQVLMTERSTIRRKPPGQGANSNNTTPTKTPSPRTPNQRPMKVPAAPSPQQIPVPRLVPASNSPAAKNNMPQINATTSKAASPINGVRNNVQKAEKRSINRNHSVTVDLTDDEPPTKIMNRNSTPTPLRVVPPHMVPQNLLAATPRHPIAQNNNPRKVYIPISGPQNQNIRSGQAIMLKSVTAPNQTPRPRGPQPHLTRMPQNQVRMPRIQNRHPAPLPESTKQYPGTYLKALPPAPDLKLSKVENGIVISWKIEGYQEDSYEEIASYQLYAYQETNSPPSTALWKKIGDVKALPLPMACTLTQFMAGFKYYFAVRAVDIRSRIGPFSLPGSILLLNKL